MKINECIDLILDDINDFLSIRSNLERDCVLIFFAPCPEELEQVHFNAREIEVIRILEETLEYLRIKEPFIWQFVKSSFPGVLFAPLTKEEIAVKRQIDALCALVVLNLGNPSLSYAFKETLMDAKTKILVKYGIHEKLRHGLSLL